MGNDFSVIEVLGEIDQPPAKYERTDFISALHSFIFNVSLDEVTVEKLLKGGYLHLSANDGKLKISTKGHNAIKSSGLL